MPPALCVLFAQRSRIRRACLFEQMQRRTDCEGGPNHERNHSSQGRSWSKKGLLHYSEVQVEPYE